MGVSLPLMGIGNSTPGPRAGTGSPLITPHGDRKRNARADSTERYSCSLPLMGIGNTAQDVDEGETSHSLPLMGIGNLSDGRGASGRASLITPHGDRKHRADLVDSSPVRLITPHGDRKRAPAPRG